MIITTYNIRRLKALQSLLSSKDATIGSEPRIQIFQDKGHLWGTYSTGHFQAIVVLAKTDEEIRPFTLTQQTIKKFLVDKDHIEFTIEDAEKPMSYTCKLHTGDVFLVDSMAKTRELERVLDWPIYDPLSKTLTHNEKGPFPEGFSVNGHYLTRITKFLIAAQAGDPLAKIHPVFHGEGPIMLYPEVCEGVLEDKPYGVVVLLMPISK